MISDKIFVFMNISDGYVPVGLLRTDGRDGFFFRYGDKFLERRDRVCLDPASIPLIREEFHSTELFSVFRDAAPDRWGRRILSIMASRHYGEMSEIEILTAMHSDDRIGALAFGPTRERPQSMASWAQHMPPLTQKQELETILNIVIKVEQLSDDRLVDSLRTSLSKDAFLQALASSLSLGGARPKATVHYDEKLWIAKFPKRGDPWNEPQVEYATMLLAGNCGIQVPTMRCLNFASGTVLLVERFDRQYGHPQHMISGFTLNKLREDGYWGSYQLMAENARRFGDVRAGQEIFRRMVFNALCSNRDDHPRNHAFFVSGNNVCMTPAYDIVPSPTFTRKCELALECGREGRAVSIDNLLSDTQPFGVHAAEAENILEDMVAVMEHWEEHFARHGVKDNDLEKLQSRFTLHQEFSSGPSPC